MKYITVDADKELHFAEKARPQLSTDDCLVKVRAIGVNRADLLQRAGKYAAPAGESSILGLEVAGDIVKCGAAVDNWQINDKVFGLVPGGGYAEYVKVKAEHLIRLPEYFTYQQGAASAEIFLTAYQSLFTIAKLPAKSKVLIHAGASGVGSAAIQLAKARQCYVVATVGRADKAEACLALGADHVLNYHETDFELWSKTHVKEGYQVILDVVGGDYINKNVNISALDGHIVLLSILGGRYCSSLDLAKLLAKRITITASTLRNRSDAYKTNLIKKVIAEFSDDFNQKKIAPIIDTVFTWQEAELAHNYMKKNENIGKLVLLLDNDSESFVLK